MSRNDVDATLVKYAGSIVAVALNIALVLGILGYFGIETTSIAAMLAGAGVAIGVAWSGLLAHLAAGAFLLILRPFKVGDVISAGGTLGTVKEIGPELRRAARAPGRPHCATCQRRRSARRDRALPDRGRCDPPVAQHPAHEVSLLDFKLEGPQIAIRPYTHNDHYWQVWFDTSEATARVCVEANWPAPAATYKVQQAVESVPPALARAQALQDAMYTGENRALASSPVSKM